MKQPSYKDLETAIDRCMLPDRFRLRRDLKKKKERAAVAARIEKSMALAARRQSRIPSATIPDILPIADAAADLKSLIQQHQVVIVAGETGSGKTTQLPKICLEAGRGIYGQIGHTQPRRIAARNIAHRIAEELGVSLGQEVGFQIRFQDDSTPETLVKLMTDGILLAEIQRDRFLEKYDTLIIDEAHERSLNIDFILGYIKRILPKRPDLKVIITSATIDLERFSKHFDAAPIVEVSGRTYPVEARYLDVDGLEEDDEEAQQLSILNALAEIETMPKGDVLIFLPGEREIRETAQTIRRKGPKGFDVLPLYARLSVADQNRVFAAHSGRRIVLATNVAETSITVPGIRYVIDPGTARISRYSLRSKVQQLPVEKVSQASANQRMGRCGRVSEGVCFRLYTEDDFAARSEFTDPEILRTNLAAVILQMLQLKLGDIAKFPFLERPNQKQINDGYTLLFELGAVDRNRQITRLGKQLSRFPIDLRFARMLIAASQFNALSEVLIIVSALTIRDPRERPFDHQAAADQQHQKHWHEQSDFLALNNLWQTFETERQSLGSNQLRKYCKSNYLSFMRMREWRDLHRQLLLVCKEEGLKLNKKPAEYSSVHRAMLTGLLGHIATRSTENEYLGARSRKQFIFPGSSQFSKRPKWMVSAELVETSRLFARQVAEIDSSWLEPLAGHLVTRTWHDPEFDADKGQVIAREEVSLFGLVIVPNRAVDFGAIDVVQSREMFIQKGLVEGRLRTRLKFFSHNRKLTRDIQKIENKARKRDILVESHVLFDFYDQHIPADVCSELDLSNFVTQSPRKAAALKLTREELMRREAELSQTQYPSKLQVGDASLPLKYKFEPGSADDGVSVNVPLVILNQVPAAQLDWVVPGLLREKCLAMLKSLPKSLRKQFVPAPQTIDRALENLDFDGRPLSEALADRLFRLTGTRVSAADFSMDDLDRHLSLNVNVLDDKGKTIASGRNLQTLVAQMGEEVSERLQQRPAHELERKALVDWDFDELPNRIELKEGGVTVAMYPALFDDGESVSIQLMESAAEAESSNQRGLLRLIRLRLADQERFLANNIPDFEKFSLYYATRGTRQQLVEHLIAAAFVYTFIENQSMVWSKAEFEQRLSKRQGLYAVLEEVARLVGQLLPQVLKIEEQINKHQDDRLVADIRTQLDGLVPAAFPSAIPFEWLRHYPKYLKGIVQRLDRYGGNVSRDHAAIDEVSPWYDRYSKLTPAEQVPLQKFRWMLEEYRISLFAQSIGTTMPVSAKRLEKEWSKVMGLRQ